MVPKKLRQQILLFTFESQIQQLAEIDDSSLVKIVCEKNPDFYKEIVRRYERKLFLYLYRLVGDKDEVEDLLQNVFVKVYRNINGFDRERKFSSWIYRIAHNEAVNFLKKKSRRRLISWEDLVSAKDKLETSSEEKDPAEKWAQKEIKEEISIAMEKLPSKYKEVLELRYFAEKSYDDISEVLGKPVNTVGTLINRAKRKLQQIMAENQKSGLGA